MRRVPSGATRSGPAEGYYTPWAIEGVCAAGGFVTLKPGQAAPHSPLTAAVRAIQSKVRYDGYSPAQAALMLQNERFNDCFPARHWWAEMDWAKLWPFTPTFTACESAIKAAWRRPPDADRSPVAIGQIDVMGLAGRVLKLVSNRLGRKLDPLDPIALKCTYLTGEIISRHGSEEDALHHVRVLLDELLPPLQDEVVAMEEFPA